MLTLRSSPASPFVRKIRIAANVLGLERDIAVEPADTMNPNDSVRRQNPLGKIPALVLEDGTVLFDSRVILEYLDHAGLRRPLAAGGAARAEVGRSSGRQGGAHAGGARSGAAGAHGASRCGSDRACLRARLPRFPLRGDVAARSSAAGRLARRICRARAGLRRDQAAGLDRVSMRQQVELTKSPGPEVRGLFMRRAAQASEPQVRPAAKDVGGERYVAAGQETAIEAAIEVAEIDVEILGLQAHIADDADFEAGAHGPAGVSDAAARQDRQGQAGVDVAHREPAGKVGQEAVEGVAYPPAHGGEPLVAGLAAPRAQHGGRPFDARPVDVALGADHRLAELPVVAHGAADEAAGHVERVHAVPLGATPTAAAVDADVEAGPGVDRIVDRPRLVVGRQIT